MNSIEKKIKSNNDMSIVRIPPQAIDLEDIIIGSILGATDSIDVVSSIINKECFYSPKNKLIYIACSKLFEKRIPIDVFTVSEQLKKDGVLEHVGGIYELSLMTSNIISTKNLAIYSNIIYEKYIRREVIKMCHDVINNSFDETIDVFEFLDKTKLLLSKINDSNNKNIVHIADITLDIVSEMRKNSQNKNEYLGFKSGIKKIDNITLGFCSPDLIIIAGGTGEGKSTLALQIAENVSKDNIVAFFSLEMSNKQLIWKVLSSELSLPVSDIRKGNLKDTEWQKLENSVYNKIENLNLYLYDKGGMSIFELISVCRNMKANIGLDMIVVDYLQLLNANGGNMKFGIREQEINYISKQLKALAKELNIPVIALSQLSRIEKGIKRLYKLSDLRESGAIEQDADGVMFVYRPHYHGMTSMSIGGEEVVFNEADCIIQFAKWRLGETGITRLLFNGASSRFEDYMHDGYDVSKIRKEKNKDDYTDNCHDSDDIPF